MRKLRDDDANGALKEYLGDSEDPREWKDEDGDKCVTVMDGRVTELSLYNCTKLTALPAEISELNLKCMKLSPPHVMSSLLRVSPLKTKTPTRRRTH